MGSRPPTADPVDVTTQAEEGEEATSNAITSSSIVVECPPVRSGVALNGETLLTEDLKKLLLEFPLEITNDKSLRGVVPEGTQFSSLHAALQYIHAALKAKLGPNTAVQFLPGSTGETSTSTGDLKIITIRLEDNQQGLAASTSSTVQLKLQVQAQAASEGTELQDQADLPLVLLECTTSTSIQQATETEPEKDTVTTEPEAPEAPQPTETETKDATPVEAPSPAQETPAETTAAKEPKDAATEDPPADAAKETPAEAPSPATETPAEASATKDTPTQPETTSDPPKDPAATGTNTTDAVEDKKSEVEPSAAGTGTGTGTTPETASEANNATKDMMETDDATKTEKNTETQDDAIKKTQDTADTPVDPDADVDAANKKTARKPTMVNFRKAGEQDEEDNDHQDNINNDDDDDESTSDEEVIAEPQETAGEAQKKRFAEQWQTMLGRLKAYKDTNGDCLVPKDYPLDQSLGSWVHAQRSNYRLKTMPQARIDALEAIAFPWKVRDIQTWETMYERLQVYHQKHGNSDVPRKCESDPRLGRWVQQQRRDYREEKLPHDKVALLENLYFVWRVAATAKGGVRRENMEEWNRMFAKLQQYQLEHGNCLVPREYEKDLELGRWVRQQRTRKSLSDEQKSQLDALGFMWKVPHKKKAQVSFEEMLERLQGFKQRYGDCMVPAIYPEDLPLGRWVQRMRQDYKKNILTDQQIFQMDSLGFTWKCARGRQKINYASDIPNYFQSQEYLLKFNAANGGVVDPNNPLQFQQPPQQDGAIWSPKAAPEFWEAQFQKLKQYQAQNGHCNVPRNHFEDQSLAKFVVAQRSFYHKGQLSEENIQKLESIGFVWRIQRHWEENFQLLKAYYDKHGNTDVPVDYAEDPKLGRWVREQRLFSKRKELSQERLDRMKELGFVWNAPGATSALTKRPKSMTCPKDAPAVVAGLGAVTTAPDATTGVKDESNNGEFGVPVASAALKEKTAKLQQANAKLGADRKNLKIENQELRRKLREAEEKNFWEGRYEQLQVYKDLNGDCLVPTGHSKLGAWVGTQRELYRKGELSQERIELLEKLGFVWERARGRPKKEEGVLRTESEKLMEEEIALQEEKVKLLEARVKLKQGKLKLQLIRDAKPKRKSVPGSSSADGPEAKKARPTI
ncbi:helicase [Seminavis robusta]|uniref:Helicase n=1 Tax=Seminavis robusta TaxID=568900 RepID=A0A9N8DR14_9STRA|nr:helicase [Seminavis robusta]|eukprot:Sro226_g092060.1 helicase (1143) ;mRNA; r:50510-54287